MGFTEWVWGDGWRPANRDLLSLVESTETGYYLVIDLSRAPKFLHNLKLKGLHRIHIKKMFGLNRPIINHPDSSTRPHLMKGGKLIRKLLSHTS